MPATLRDQAQAGILDLEQLLGACRRFLGEADDIDLVGEPPKIIVVRVERTVDDLVGVRAVRIEYVVAPVCIEHGTMRIAIPLVGRLSIVGVEHCEKFRQEVDQHAAGYEAGFTDARETVVSSTVSRAR